MELLVRRKPGKARANWGRWIVDCPSPFCTSALAAAPGTESFTCWDCGAEGEIEWPANWGDIERLLTMRPDPITRNWLPGETLEDLQTENVENGIFSLLDLPPGLHGYKLLEIVDDRIALDKVALDFSRRAQIGA